MATQLISNLKQRLKTGLLLGFLAIGCILFLKPAFFLVIASLLTILCLWEWINLMGLACWGAYIIYFLCLFFFALLSVFFFKSVFFFTLIAWLVIFLLLLCLTYQPHCLTIWDKKLILLLRCVGFLFFIPFWLALYAIQYGHPGLLIYLLCLICASDMFAYFAGSRWGKHKLSPILSPGKTWEGFLASMIGSILLALGLKFILFYYTGLSLSFLAASFLGGLASFFGMVGDLFESLQKRLMKVKESGHCLPGHGGLLDRLDSAIAALPIIFFVLLLWIPLK